MTEEQQKLKIMHEFRNQLINLLDELIEQFPEETDLFFIRIFMRDQIPVSDVLGRYIRDLLPLKQQIYERDSAFFLNNSILYTHGDVSDTKVNHFKQLWISNKLDDEDRDVIWQWMLVLTKLAEQYFQKFGHIPGWN
jgi:hypothetical protein